MFTLPTVKSKLCDVAKCRNFRVDAPCAFGPQKVSVHYFFEADEWRLTTRIIIQCHTHTVTDNYQNSSSSLSFLTWHFVAMSPVVLCLRRGQLSTSLAGLTSAVVFHVFCCYNLYRFQNKLMIVIMIIGCWMEIIWLTKLKMIIEAVNTQTVHRRR